MHIEDYGEWTNIQYHDGRSEDRVGHIHVNYGDRLEVSGYAHIEHGKVVAKYGDWTKRLNVGWTVSEIIGVGIVNSRGVAVGKKCT